MEYICKIPSPVGLLTASSDGESITGLWLEGQKYFASTLSPENTESDLPVFSGLRKWLDCYFSGGVPDFMPPLNPKGSAFRKSVWKILCGIKYGTTDTYGNIAKQLFLLTGKSASARAVGGAVGHNPVSIIIPCHRVVGSGGRLTGYAGGTDKKAALLKLEGLPPFRS